MAYQDLIKKAITQAAGQSFWVKYTITSSNITTTAQNLSVASTGLLAIKQCIVQTDATGLAGGTNFKLQTSNAKGAAVFFSETVANLGANVTFDLVSHQPSVTHNQAVLEVGQTIQYLNSVAVGTGAGTIDVYIQFERVDAKAYLQDAAARGAF